MKKCLFTLVILFFLVSTSSSQNKTVITRESDSLVVAALALVSADSLNATMQSLQDMGTRFMIAPNRKEVATWIMNKFLSMGIEEVRLDSFLCTSNINYPPIVFDTTTWQYNVEARIEGASVPDEEVVLLGHYDCVIQDGDPLIFSPGADDNASGTAALIECARVINEMGYQPEQTLIFLASAAEELMYYGDAGSEHYAEEASAAGRNIVMVLNNDMIAYNNGSWTLDLFTHTFSPHITEMGINIIVNYTTLNYNAWPPTMDVGGDIQPFLDAGYHGLYFMEPPINPNYHKMTDLVDYCDFLYLAEVVKVSLGCILQSDISVGLAEMPVNSSSIQVYPNPASIETCFLINDPANSSWELKIIAMNGKENYKGKAAAGYNCFNISFLNDGMYIMIFTNGTEIQYKKLIVKKAVF